jgi:hypothetical protein
VAQLLLFAAVVYGATMIAVCGSTFWMIPYESWNPVRTIAAHFLRSGIVEYNLGVAAGLPALLSLAPPIAACAIAFFAAAHGAAVRARTLAAAILLGLLGVGAALSIPPTPAAVTNSHRDGLASVLLPAMRAGWH